MVSPGTHLVKNHESQCRIIESQFKKTASPWVFCNHTVNLKTDSKTLYYSLLKKKIYSFDCKLRQRQKEISVVSQKPQKSNKQDTLQNHLQIDQSIFASQGTHSTIYFTSWGTFMRQGRRTQR